MGNVLASSSAPSPSAGMPSPPPPPINVPGQTGETSADSSSSPSFEQNPGSIEDLHKKCKEVFPSVFEGLKFMVNKGLSNHFQISHTLSMGSVTPSGYRFGATYVGTNVISPTEAYPILVGDIDPSGNLNANVIHQHKNVRAKFAAQVQDSKYTVSQLTLDYRGLDFTASSTFANMDLFSGSGVAVFHYLQNVSPTVALGAEMLYQRGPQIPGGELAMLSLAGRYTSPNYTISGTMGAAGIHACYYHKQSENLQIGVEVDTNLRIGESVCSIGYQVDLPKANLVFRGMVDSNWTVGAVLEKKLMPLPFTFTLSAMLNHTKNQCRFGCGFILG